MVLLPSIASSNIADHLSKPLPTITHQRIVSLIGAGPIKHPLASATPTTTSVVAPTVGASVSVPTDTPVSDSVPHPVPYFVDTGASLSVASSRSDFTLEVSQAPYGLLRSAASLVSDSDSKLTSVASKALASSTPVDPYTLITGEDVSVDPIDLSSPDITTIAIGSDSGPPFIKVHFDVRQFGTASLTFIFSPNWSLIKVFVTPTQVDWIHWVPLPRLTPTESYFHIFGRDYFQAFALLHLIPIWIALVSALLRSE